MSDEIDDLLQEADDTAAISGIEKAKSKGKAFKEKVASEPRVNKGVMVRFHNKAGQEIVGYGVHYYVVRYKGKLHYKEASAVTVLPEGWKEGDAIPGLDQEDDLTA